MMLRSILLLLLLPLAGAGAAEPSLTIYNQDFAVIRSTVPLALQAGVNEVRWTDITARLEPSSVILRDPKGAHPFEVVEQTFRADPVSEATLLKRFEGQTIDFEIDQREKGRTIVPGRIVRGGSQGGMKPIIEMNGKLRFDLPGTPLFPKLPDDTVLKPELHWKIATKEAKKFEAEIAYLTSGMSWSASYNVTLPVSGDELQLTAWVTIDNQSGKDFANARTKLIAGDVNKTPPATPRAFAAAERTMVRDAQIPVPEKAFDEYHLYTLPRPLDLRDGESKQIELFRADGVHSARLYLFDANGYEAPPPFPGGPIFDENWGTEGETRVGVVQKIKNSEANHLGRPLPAGRWRFYRRDADQQLEFTGEHQENHTAKDETLRIFTGTAFDLAAERRQTAFTIDRAKQTMEESFEIKLRNHKKEAVEIHVIEHLNRWQSWEIVTHSDPFTKKNAHTIEFVVPLKPDEEKNVTYRARYIRLPTK